MELFNICDVKPTQTVFGIMFEKKGPEGQDSAPISQNNQSKVMKVIRCLCASFPGQPLEREALQRRGCDKYATFHPGPRTRPRRTRMTFVSRREYK